jgi:preprotein translocase subunit SecG
MLSFLRDQNGSNLPGQQPLEPANGKAPGDGAEPAQEQQFLTVAAHGKRARKSTIILVVLFIIGLVCLWFMIKRSSPETASAASANADEAKVEGALARLTGIKSEVFNKMDEIVKKFYEFSGVKQVEVKDLAKNPFALETVSDQIKEKPDTKDLSAADLAMIWQRQIRQKTKDMKLLSIIRSDQGNSCMIGSRILREGDTIQGFTVREIRESSVKLQWTGDQTDGHPAASQDNVEVVLTLSE